MLNKQQLVKHLVGSGMVHNRPSSHCQFGNFARVYFRETSRMRSFAKINPSRNREITLSFNDVSKSSLGCDFLAWQICLLMLFAKIKLSRKFSNLQSLIGYVQRTELSKCRANGIVAKLIKCYTRQGRLRSAWASTLYCLLR